MITEFSSRNMLMSQLDVDTLYVNISCKYKRRICSKYLDRQTQANSKDPDQTLQNTASDLVYTVCIKYRNFCKTLS